jgi:excisionase family DNA binding protein
MDGEFAFVYLLLGGGFRHGGPRDVFDSLCDLRANDGAMAAERAAFEDWLRAGGNSAACGLLDLLFHVNAYLSRVISGPVPVLLSRAELNTLVASGEHAGGATLGFARSLQRLLQSAPTPARPNDEFFGRIEEMLARTGGAGVPKNQRYMSTEQIAQWLGLATKTVRRLFTEGKLIGRKVGNEWRATREQLEESPYLRKRRRRGDAAVE